jgi:hypothetical protein
MRPLEMRAITGGERSATSNRFPSLSLLFALYLCTPLLSRSQTHGILCTGGAGRFTSKFATGVTITVDATKNGESGGFSTRACEAVLASKKIQIVAAKDAWIVDIDVLGADLGLGMPVVAFQVMKREIDPGMTYEVYSLDDPPKLLRTITGGDSYRAADANLDGSIEIWTRDAETLNHFEGIPPSDFDFLPTLVLRFEKQRLVDASAEFQPYYDGQIEQIRKQFDSRLLPGFKNSDGKLDVIPPEQLNNLHDLLTTKIQVLEIVWAYLYSGREEKAWSTLREMWPAGDFDRIRAVIERARTNGIRREVQETAPALASRRKKPTRVYDLKLQPKMITPLAKSMPSSSMSESTEVTSSSFPGISMPQTMTLDIPTLHAEHPFPRDGVLMDLTIDAAGKVYAARIASAQDQGPIGDALMSASSHWKFVPAMENGKAIASHIWLTVSPFQ